MSETSQALTSSGDSSHTLQTERLLHNEVQFEQADIATSRIVGVLFVIGLVFVGVALACRWVLDLNASGLDRTARSPQYAAPADRLPTAPRLEPLDRSETTASSDVFAKQLAMEHELHGLGDTVETGFVHIPIEQAMKLFVSQLSVRPGDAKPPTKGFGLVDGGESNSGRLFSEGPIWLRQRK